MPEHAQSTKPGGYAKDVLVSTDWVAEHLGDPGVKILEVDVDVTAYSEGHIPGAIGFNWHTDLQDQVRRDILSKEQLEATLGRAGIRETDTIVLYGDNHNWFAAYAYWLLKIYGHEKAYIMNGGRAKWIAEGRPLTKEVPEPQPVVYRAKDPDLSIRATREEVLAGIGKVALVDVRSPQEFTGEVLAPPGLPETAQRGGHIPTAANIPWSKAANEDGTFKSADELRALYEGAGIRGDREVVAYCRIGERSSHTWFVLHELLGYERVKNYDGSWTEWGSMVGMPIER
ncbi:MAG: sulfurtransferase [Clostridia bacterium]|nr:sulfurtransferase [Clostridia bacterium]